MYNCKINKNGTYRKFYGWSVISMVQNDLRFIYNYIRNSNLNNYFSALPSSSYHMTIYNIWCNGSELIPYQERFIKDEFGDDEKIKEELEEVGIGFFNPNNLMDTLFDELNNECSTYYQNTTKLNIKNVVYTGGNIQIRLSDSKSFSGLTNLRDILISTGEYDDQMSCYHITLAYQYKDIPPDEIPIIEKSLNMLNKLLNKQSVIIDKPCVYSFRDMTAFTKYTSSY